MEINICKKMKMEDNQNENADPLAEPPNAFALLFKQMLENARTVFACQFRG